MTSTITPIRLTKEGIRRTWLSTPDPLLDADYGDAAGEIMPHGVYSKGEVVPNKVAHWHPDGSYVGMTSSRYDSVQHYETIDAIRKCIYLSGLDTSGVRHHIQVSANHAQMCYTVRLPAVETEAPGGDKVCLTFGARNSFDGSTKVELYSAGHLDFCLNGQVWLKNPIGVYAAKHNSLLDIDAGIRQVKRAVDVMRDEVDLGHRMADRKVTFDEAKDIFLALAGVDDPEIRVALHHGYDYLKDKCIRNQTYSYLKKVFTEKYEPHMGSTQWAVYNALTDWSTHMPRRANSNVVKLDRLRNQKVVQVCTSHMDLAA